VQFNAELPRQVMNFPIELACEHALIGAQARVAYWIALLYNACACNSDFPDFKHNQHRPFYGLQEGYEEQKLARVKGAGRGKEKGVQVLAYSHAPIKSKTLYSLVPNPLENLAFR